MWNFDSVEYEEWFDESAEDFQDIEHLLGHRVVSELMNMNAYDD